MRELAQTTLELPSDFSKMTHVEAVIGDTLINPFLNAHREVPVRKFARVIFREPLAT